MVNKYVIAWKSENNGRIGQGHCQMEFEQAQRVAMDLNKGHPAYKHVPVPAQTAPQKLPEIIAKVLAIGEAESTLTNVNSPQSEANSIPVNNANSNLEK